MRKHESRTIDGIQFTVNQFGATEGWRLFVTLTKIAAAPLAKGLKALPDGGLSVLADMNLGSSAGIIGEAITELMNNIDEDLIDGLTKRLLAYTSFKTEGKDREVLPVFDTLFQGRYATLVKVLVFVLEVNFAGPLQEWLAAALVDSGEPEKEKP